MTTYKAFVSSTYEDLKHHRRHVIAELRSGGIHVDPMEKWTASSSVPKELSKKRVDDCNLCVLLVARRRGHIPKGAEMSITQMEYAQAVALGIDVLPFLLDEKADWDSAFDEADSDPGLAGWRSELGEKHVISTFGTKPESVPVLPAILRWLQEKPGIDPKRLAALNSVRNVTDHVRKAVAHGHDFANRLDWVKELQKLADTYRDLIPDLYMPIQRISWKVRDHSFDHNLEDSSQYCCDELITDLRALQFEVLKLTQKSMAKEDVEAMAIEILEDIELMNMEILGFREITPGKPLGVPENSEEFRRYQKELEKSHAEARRQDEERRARHLKTWREGIEWHKDFAVAHKDPPPAV
jgi:hypothetical protein